MLQGPDPWLLDPWANKASWKNNTWFDTWSSPGLGCECVTCVPVHRDFLSEP